MSAESTAIGMLKKVVLELCVGRQAGVWDLTATPIRFEFVFGIGHQLTGFELLLEHKMPGDNVNTVLAAVDLERFMGHLRLPPLLLPSQIERLYLGIRVLKVDQAGGREVIRHLADLAACGDSCCGDH